MSDKNGKNTTIKWTLTDEEDNTSNNHGVSLVYNYFFNLIITQFWLFAVPFELVLVLFVVELAVGMLTGVDDDEWWPSLNLVLLNEDNVGFVAAWKLLLNGRLAFNENDFEFFELLLLLLLVLVAMVRPLLLDDDDDEHDEEFDDVDDEDE